jgi:hypothetical protein
MNAGRVTMRISPSTNVQCRASTNPPLTPSTEHPTRLEEHVKNWSIQPSLMQRCLLPSARYARPTCLLNSSVMPAMQRCASPSIPYLAFVGHGAAVLARALAELGGRRARNALPPFVPTGSMGPMIARYFTVCNKTKIGISLSPVFRM